MAMLKAVKSLRGLGLGLRKSELYFRQIYLAMCGENWLGSRVIEGSIHI